MDRHYCRESLVLCTTHPAGLWRIRVSLGRRGASVTGYEEFIGAKKHLVLGVLSHTGPAQGSTAFNMVG
jgi:hypothetical protein